MSSKSKVGGINLTGLESDTKAAATIAKNEAEANKNKSKAAANSGYQRTQHLNVLLPSYDSPKKVTVPIEYTVTQVITEIHTHAESEAHDGSLDLYLKRGGIWLDRSRTLHSYLPLSEEEEAELKKRPDAIAFQKAKVHVPLMKTTEDVHYLGGETRVRGLIQQVKNKPLQLIHLFGLWAKVQGDWEATLLEDHALISSLDFTSDDMIVFELKERVPLRDDVGPLTPRTLQRQQSALAAGGSNSSSGSTTPRGSSRVTIHDGPTTPRGTLVNSKGDDKSPGSTSGGATPRASNRLLASLSGLKNTLTGSSSSAETAPTVKESAPISNVSGGTTPRGSIYATLRGSNSGTPVSADGTDPMTPRSRSRIGLPSLGSIKNLMDDNVIKPLTPGRIQFREISLMLPDGTRVSTRIDCMQTVLELVKKLQQAHNIAPITPSSSSSNITATSSPAATSTASTPASALSTSVAQTETYGLYWPAEMKWLKDRKIVSHYLQQTDDGVELHLRRKTADAPEAMDEAAKKAKQERKEAKQREKEERKQRRSSKRLSSVGPNGASPVASNTQNQSSGGSFLEKTRSSTQLIVNTLVGHKRTSSRGDVVPEKIPLKNTVMVKLTQWLVRKGALNCVGLFRVAGASQNVRKLHRSFADAEPALADVNDIHEVAEALKLYLREAPAPLLTNYEAFAPACETDDEAKQSEILRAAISQLPDESHKVLATLFGFLSRVAARQNLNKMGPMNLGTVFGPNMFASPEILDLTLTMRHNKLATLLVEGAETLFPESVSAVRSEEQHVAHITTALASGYLTNVPTAFGISPSNSSTVVSSGTASLSLSPRVTPSSSSTNVSSGGTASVAVTTLPKSE